MTCYILVAIVSGILFGVMDAVINANSLARNLYKAYEPIARTSVNVSTGVTIDLVYGFVMAGVFLLLYASLPGGTGLVKGLSFALLVWFFRVVMSVASTWMMFKVPAAALAYTLFSGLAEMLVLGVLYGATLKPSS